MEKIFPAIGNFAVGTGNFNSRFVSIIRSFLFAAKRFLYLFEFATMPFEMPGIGNVVTVASSQQTTKSNVHTY